PEFGHGDERDPRRRPQGEPAEAIADFPGQDRGLRIRRRSFNTSILAPFLNRACRSLLRPAPHRLVVTGALRLPGRMTGHIAALYRHPVKGFPPERLGQADLTAGERFPCDRLYAVENGPSGFDPAAPGHISKQKFTVL